MAQRKRVELEQAVIRAARDWLSNAYNHWTSWSVPVQSSNLRVAVEALDAIPPSEITPRRGASNADGPDTQIEAGHRAMKPLHGVRLMVVDELVAEHYRDRPGMTTQALETRLRKPHTTTSSACNGLKEAGWIMDSGLRRLTAASRRAIVWTLTPAALAHLGLNHQGAT